MKAAVAWAAGGIEYRRLPVKPLYRAVDNRLPCFDGGIADQEFRRKIISAIDDDIVSGKQPQHIFFRQFLDIGLDGNGRIYLQNEDGVGTVINASKEFKVLATNPLGERTLASYAPVDGGILIRSEKELFRVGGQ